MFIVIHVIESKSCSDIIPDVIIIVTMANVIIELQSVLNVFTK